MRQRSKAIVRVSVLLVIGLAAVLLSMASAQTETIRVMRPGYPQQARVFLSKAAAAFEQTHPNVKIDIVDADYNTYHSRIMVWVAGGQEPDVYLASSTEIPDLQNMGALLALNSIIDPQLKNDIPASAWKTYEIDGKTWAIPGATTGIGLWYNKDLFKKAGLDPSKPPATWGQLLTDAQQIQEKTGVYGLGLNLGRAEDTMMDLAGVIIYSAIDGPIISPKGQPLFDTPNGVAAVQFIDDLVNKYKVTEPHPEQYKKTDIRLMLADGKVAMAADGPWIMQALSKVTDMSSPSTSMFGVAGAPASPLSGTVPMVPMGNDAWVVSSHSKYPEVAKEFLRLLVQPKWQFAQDLAVEQTPFRKSIWQNWSNQIPDAWVYKQLVQNLDSATLFNPFVTQASQADQYFNDALQQAVLGVKTPQQALDEAAAKIKALYQ